MESCKALILAHYSSMHQQHTVKEKEKMPSLYMLASDMMTGSKDTEKLQKAPNKLRQWAKDNDLQINNGKNVHMVFRKGG